MCLKMVYNVNLLQSSSDSLWVYDSKHYLQLYLENCAYKITDKQMIDYLNDNLFETDED